MCLLSVRLDLLRRASCANVSFFGRRFILADADAERLAGRPAMTSKRPPRHVGKTLPNRFTGGWAVERGGGSTNVAGTSTATASRRRRRHSRRHSRRRVSANAVRAAPEISSLLPAPRKTKGFFVLTPRSPAVGFSFFFFLLYVHNTFCFVIPPRSPVSGASPVSTQPPLRSALPPIAPRVVRYGRRVQRPGDEPVERQRRVVGRQNNASRLPAAVRPAVAQPSQSGESFFYDKLLLPRCIPMCFACGKHRPDCVRNSQNSPPPPAGDKIFYGISDESSGVGRGGGGAPERFSIRGGWTVRQIIFDAHRKSRNLILISKLFRFFIRPYFYSSFNCF